MIDFGRNEKVDFLPEEFNVAHQLCFILHDILVQIIVSGEKGGIFRTNIEFESEIDKKNLENSDDIISWLKSKNDYDNIAKVLRVVVLPAVLSDMLHCVYESLQSSKKAKLNITYMLIRKPIQESLYLLESIVIDDLDFSKKMSDDILKLRPKNTKSVAEHSLRIEKVIELLGEKDVLKHDYIAQLRYDKSKEDSFDGVCNQAMHLFTEHKSIKTDNMNINFIFSGFEEKLTQWSYFYGRIPYLMYYIYKVVEHILAVFVKTSPDYLDDMNRRVSAMIILWWESLDDLYKNDELGFFVAGIKKRLHEKCKSLSFREPNIKDLERMAETGAYPDEGRSSVMKRVLNYEVKAWVNEIYFKYIK